MDAGRIIAEKYRIIEILGKGSYGTVYLAEEISHPGMRRALKEIEESRIPPEDRNHLLDLLRREAELLTRLRHAGLPSVTDFFSTGDRHYLVMEFIPGKNLEEIKASRNGIIECEGVFRWALQLASILEYLHNHKPEPVIFRDLKPSNIMLSSATYMIMLVDFGIARYFTPGKLRDTQFLGTPGFSPPEQYGSGQSDQRTDIYSFGATLYFLLTDQDIARYDFKFPPITQINKDVPPLFGRIIMKCLSINPGERYQSMTDILKDMRRITFEAHSPDYLKETDKEKEALSRVLSKFSLSFYPHGLFADATPLDDLERIGIFSTAEFSGLFVDCFRKTGDVVMCQTVAIVTLEGVNFPRFLMRGESIMDINVFGEDLDIDFKESPRFSKSFYVTGPDRKAVESFFRPEIVEAFSENPMKNLVKLSFNMLPGAYWIVEAKGPDIVFYCAGVQVPTNSLEKFAEYARKVLLPFVNKGIQSRPGIWPLEAGHRYEAEL
ncbi:MAG: serine/threonine-protein kinase [Candidatus Eremiobacteraeota bacterium]|nr:serine/threonine-protein kinase [Candidatus Eremiobacteraeota bacterium]